MNASLVSRLRTVAGQTVVKPPAIDIEAADRIEELEKKLVAGPEWFDASQLPPDWRPVLVELRPKRKRMKPEFAVASYFRTEPGVHDAEPCWACPRTSEDLDVVRWQSITPFKKGQL